MRAIMILVIVVLIAVFLGFLFGFLIPFLRSEFSLTDPDTTVSVQSEPEDATGRITYDNMGLPVYGNDVSLFVINSSSPEDAAYAPQLATVGEIQVNADIAPALTMMKNAAVNDGIVLEFQTGYISYEQQDILFNNKVEELMAQGYTKVMARITAQEELSPAGESDFQTGMCVKLQGDNETFKTSKTYEWLNANASIYGFVFRFPEGKQVHTGKDEDYLVLRYVGADNAERMRQLSMCLEEYLTYLSQQGN